MLLLLVPLSIASASILYSIYQAQYYFRFRLDDIKLEASANKIKKAATVYLMRVYRVLALLFVFFGSIFFFVESLRGVFAGFVMGFLFAAVAGYFSLLFLTRLNAYITNRASHGVVDAFQNSLGGGNALGIFTVGFALLLVTLFYTLFTPTAGGFIGLIFGAGLVALFCRFTASVYVQSLLFVGSSEEGAQVDSRNPVKIASLAGRSVIDALGTVLTAFAVTLSALSGAIIVGASTLPGLSNAVAFPMLIIAVGLLSSAVGIKLVRASSTTNVFRNLLSAVLGVVVTSSIIVFPVTLWALGGDIPYSSVYIWLSAFLGLLFAGGILALYFLNMFRGLNTKQISAIFALIISSGPLVPYLLAGHYGVAIFILAFVSIICAMLALHLFGSVADSAHNFAEISELSKERKQSIIKLSFISHIVREGINMYIWTAAMLTSLLLFIFFQQEAAAKVTDLDFTLGNPIVLAGIFLGIGFAYWLISGIFASVSKVSKYVGKLSNKEEKYHSLTADTTGKSIKHMRAMLVYIFVFPVLFGLLLGFSFLGGFLAGAIFMGAFLSLSIILKEKASHGDLRSVQDLKETEGDLEEETGSHYTETISVTLALIIQVLVVVTLVWVIV